MFQYIVRRLLAAIPVLIGITLITFVLVNVVPGDPALNMLGQHPDPKTLEKVREKLGLNDPLPVQYLRFLGHAAMGDLGKSFRSNVPITTLIMQRFPVTVEIATSAMAVGAALGLFIGIISAVRQYSFVDNASMVVALAFISAPIFWTAIIAQVIFGLYLGWVPISGFGEVKYLILPAAVLGSRYAASIARYTRSSLLEVIGQDYVRTARSKGLSERAVIYKHALKNALIPVITIMGLELGGLLTGSILTETIFGIPGLGRLTIVSLEQRDLPLIQGTVVFTAIVFVLSNLAVDVLYGFLDPRIRYD